MQPKTPKRLRFRKIYRGPIIRITIDVSPMIRALQQLALAIPRVLQAMAPALERWQHQLLQAQRSISTVAAAR